MGLWGQLRNLPCPCGGPRKAKRCCLQPHGTWKKAPVDIAPTERATGQANPRCYMRALADCSEKISREHYMSKTILEALCEEGDRPQLQVSGLPWMGPGETVNLTPNALASKVLCVRHNGMLSKLDDEALRFFLAIRELRYPPQRRRHLVLFAGNDIERWMLKTMLGTLAAGLAQFQQRRKIEIGAFGEHLPRLLLYPGEWKPALGQGLYYLANPAMTFVERGQVAFRPVFERTKNETYGAEKNEIYGAELLLRGIELLLGTSPKIKKYPRLRNATYRPFGFFSGEEPPRREIWLSWPDNQPRPPIILTFTGEKCTALPCGFTGE